MSHQLHSQLAADDSGSTLKALNGRAAIIGIEQAVFGVDLTHESTGTVEVAASLTDHGQNYSLGRPVVFRQGGLQCRNIRVVDAGPFRGKGDNGVVRAGITPFLETSIGERVDLFGRHAWIRVQQTQPHEKRVGLRTALASGQLLRLPGAFSPLVAMLIEQIGFDGVYISGAVLSANLGLPDIGLTTLTEVAQRGHAIDKLLPPREERHSRR